MFQFSLKQNACLGFVRGFCAGSMFMGEIKFDVTLEKIKFLVSFMLLFTMSKLLPTLRLSCQKTIFFF